MTELTETTFESLKLLPGQPLSLEFEGYDGERDKSVLVGYRTGRSIIITTPTHQGVAMSVKPKTQVKVRLFVNQINGACGFETSVQHVSVIPFPHLHLAMPKQLYVGEVRKAVRARVHVIASVLNHWAENNQTISAIIDDLSENGARIHSNKLALENEADLSLAFKLKIANIDKLVKVKSIVRSVSEDPKLGYIYGLQFIEVSEGDKIALHAFVLSQLHLA